MGNHCFRSVAWFLAFSCVSGQALPTSAQTLEEVRTSIRLGQRGQALEQINAYVAVHPEDPQGYFLKGVVLSETGRVAEAIAVFSRMTEDFPQLAEPFNNLAALYAKDHQLEKAREALLSALKVRPNYGAAFQNLGDVYTALAAEAYAKAGESSASASAPAYRPPVQTVPAPERQEVATALSEWIEAWSRQDVNRYLGFYAADFKPASGLARGDWEEQRRRRLRKPEGIVIKLDHPRWANVGPARWKVVFSLQYNSGRLKVRSTKAMVWSRQNGRWLIESETAG